MTLRLLLASLSCCAVATAQVVTTSPAGMLNVPGETVVEMGPFSILGFPVTDTIAFTQIDASQPAVPRVITALSFRRPTTTYPGAVGGPARMAIRMAHGDYSLVSANTVLVDSLRTGPWVDVFTLKSITLPDWTQAATPPPAAFDLRMQLDVPFAFNGTDALIFQVLLLDTAVGVDATNRTHLTTPVQNYGVGLGCPINGQEMRVFANWTVYTDTAQGFYFSAGSNVGPGSVGPAVLGIGWSQANTPIAGVCAPLLTSGEHYMLMTNPFVFGTNRMASLSVPYTPVFVGQLDLHVQAWARLSGQPVPFRGSYGTHTGPIPAPRSDGFQCALADEIQNGFSFMTDATFVKNRAAMIGIE